MGTTLVRGLASVPFAGSTDIQYLAHPRIDRYGPSTIGTLGSDAGTLGRCTYSFLDQLAVVWGVLYLELTVREFQMLHSLEYLVEFQLRYYLSSALSDSNLPQLLPVYCTFNLQHSCSSS